MGFPVGYSDLFLPKLLLHTLSVFSLLRRLLSTLLRLAGFPDFLESPESGSWPEHSPPYSFGSLPIPAALMREILPIVKFSDLHDPPESCAVCLYEFQEDDETRRLANCRHVFHRGCVDRWMSYDQRTCPLCRTVLIPDEFTGAALNPSFWAAEGMSELHFHGEDLDSHVELLGDAGDS